jgi:hypothetical protein
MTGRNWAGDLVAAKRIAVLAPSLANLLAEGVRGTRGDAPAQPAGPRVSGRDDAAVLLPDSAGGAPWWAPAPELLPPADGTFRYVYRATGHDADGDATINASVTLSLRFPPPPPDQPQARPVVWSTVAARLRVPYVDAESGEAAAADLPATVDAHDDRITCTVEVDGALARATYGVLSTPGFQNQPARLIVQTSFGAVRAVPKRPPALVRARIERLARPVPVDPRIDAPPVVYELPRKVDRRHPRENLELVATREILSIPAPTAGVTVDVPRTVALDVLVPCRDHPELYQQDKGDGGAPAPIGCQEAFQLGRVPARRFAPMPAFGRDGRYQVWESLQQPATYLVKPEHYRVGRAPDGAPTLGWIQVFDATHDADLPCVLRAACVPDLTPVEVIDLGTRLRTAAGRHVTLLLPTSPAVGLTGAAVTGATVTGHLDAVLDDDTVHLSLRAGYAEAAVMSAQLTDGGAVATLEFRTGDPQLALATTVHLDAGELAGPYPDGPVLVAGGRIVNNADTAATVVAIWSATDDGGWTPTALDPPLAIPPGASAPLPSQPGTNPIAQVTLAPADGQRLAVRRVYLENLHATVLVERDIEFTGGITAVELAFVVSSTEVAKVPVPASAPVFEVNLVQPLVADRKAFDRLIKVVATVTDSSGATRDLPPRTVDLSRSAAVKLSSLLAG